MPKKTSITNDRLALLKSKEALYVITCIQAEYYCKNHEDGHCPKGFFSLFLQAVYGIQFALQWNLSYYVDFGNLNKWGIRKW